MDKIGDLVSRQMNSKGISRELTASRICYYAKEVSNGEYDIISFKGGVVTISTDSPIKAQEIQLQSRNIIKKINQKIGSNLVEMIRFRIQ